MSARGGKPPLSIRVFAVLFTVQGLVTFVTAMMELPCTQASYAGLFPTIHVTRDLTIVASSARLSIVLIPVVLAWWRQAGSVRWLVSAMLALRLLLLRSQMPVAEWVVLALAMAATICLFTDSSRHWFAQAHERPLPQKRRGFFVRQFTR